MTRDELRAGPRLGPRVFAAMGLVVLAGAATMVLVSLLIAPVVFTWHLDRAAVPQSTEAAQHVRDGFALAAVVSTTVGALAALAVAAGVAWFVARRISGTIQAVAEAAGRLAEGDYSARVEPPRTGPELAGLADSVNDLADRLETAEQARIRLMADLAHELRTPVASIAAAVEALADGVLPPDAEALDALAEQAMRLSRLTDDLAAVSRAEERAFRLRPATIGLAAAARACASSASARYSRAAVALDPPPAAPEVVVRADPDRLAEVIGELLTNALHHCRAGDRVAITAGRDGGSGWLSITDTGAGFDPAAAERIFERFYRADPARGGRTGSGIGLTIARALIKAQGGTLTAASPGPGGGAVLTLTLPAAPQAPPLHGPAPPPPGP